MGIKIVNEQTQPGTTTLNEIPIGTAFTGEVLGDDKVTWYSGLFIKGAGPFKTSCCGTVRDVYVIRLSESKIIGWNKCAPVRNYVPVDLTITIQVKK